MENGTAHQQARLQSRGKIASAFFSTTFPQLSPEIIPITKGSREQTDSRVVSYCQSFQSSLSGFSHLVFMLIKKNQLQNSPI